MLDQIGRIAAQLRHLGIDLSVDQQADAARALMVIDPLDRCEVYAALCATLVRREEHLPALLTLLDIFLDAEMPDGTAPAPLPLADRDEAVLRTMLRQALLRFDRHHLRLIAVEAVRRYAGFVPGRAVGGTYYVTRTLRMLDLDAAEREIAGPDAHGADLLVAQALSQRRRRFVREAVDSAVRGLLVADRGADELARLRRAPILEEIDILHASADQLARLDRAMAPLARRLVRRLRTRSRSSAAIDMRGTARMAMASGGVVRDLAQPRRAKRPPRIVVLADVSGSVASFAQFTLGFLQAMSQAFSQAHYFAFVDGIVDVTQTVGRSGGGKALAVLLEHEAGLVRVDGRSDYGFAFVSFWERWHRLVDAQTTVLILGDGRNNNRACGDEALAAISSRAHRVYWLNPESPENWDMGDSVMAQYRPCCSRIIACKTLMDLQSFVATLG